MPGPTKTRHSGGGQSRWTLGCLLAVFVAPLLLCSGVATWWFARQTIARQGFQSSLQQLRQQGVPTDSESLLKYRSDHSDPTFAEPWMALLNLTSSPAYSETTQEVPVVGVVTGGPPEPPEPGKPWKYEAKVAEFLDRWQETIKEIEEVALQAGPIRTDLDEISLQSPLDYVQAHRSIARLMALQHQYAVHQRDSEKAYRSIMAILGTARALEAEPLAISQLVRCAIAGVAMDAIRQSIQFDLLSDEQLVAIDGELARLDDYAKTFHTGILGERVVALELFENPPADGPNLNPMGMRYTDVRNMLHWFNELETIVDGTSTPDDFLRAIEDYKARFQRQMGQGGVLQTLDSTMTMLLLPSMEAFALAVVRTSMQSRLARTAIRVRMYRHQQGVWPDSLDRLSSIQGVANADLRPVGGKPFGYRIEGDRARVWGFIPTSSQDSTPAEPPESDPDGPGASDLSEWNWLLLP